MPVTGDVLAVLGLARRDSVLRHLGLPALPPVRRRHAPGRAAAADAGATARRRVLRIVPAYWVALTRARDLPRDRRRLQRGLVALLLLSAALLGRDARRRHPGRLEAVRGGQLLSPAAALGVRGRPNDRPARTPAAGCAWSSCRARRYSRPLGAAVQVAADRQRGLGHRRPRACSASPSGSRSAWRWPWRAWPPSADTAAARAPCASSSSIRGCCWLGAGARLRRASPCCSSRAACSASCRALNTRAAGGRDAACDRADRPSGPACSCCRRSSAGAPAGLPRRVLAARPLLWLGLVSYGHLPLAPADRPAHRAAGATPLTSRRQGSACSATVAAAATADPACC